MNINVTPQFVLAGESTFTVSNGSGKHYTYHVYQAKPTPQFPNPAWFIKVLTGPDNSADYSYVGMLLPSNVDCNLKLTGRSKFGDGSDPVKVIRWALKIIWGKKELPPGYSIKHDGKCGKCGAKLTNPASLDTGLGPGCAEQLGVEWAEKGAQWELQPAK